MPMDLSSAGRSFDLSHLSMKNVKSRASFTPTNLAKQSRMTPLLPTLSISLFRDGLFCPVKCLRHYLTTTSQFRQKEGLFLAIAKPHQAVVSSTIARWLKFILVSAGVDTTIFTAHSTEGALPPKLSCQGLPFSPS